MTEKKDFLSAEQDKNKKEKTEKEKQIEQKKVERNQQELKKLRETNELLAKIKAELEKIEQSFNNEGSLVEKINDLLIESSISIEEVMDILDKIEEVITLNEQTNEIPKEYLFTKEEYLQALLNPQKRKELIGKLNQIIDNTSTKLTSADNVFLFMGLYFLQNKSLIKIHDNCLDIKENLTSNS